MKHRNATSRSPRVTILTGAIATALITSGGAAIAADSTTQLDFGTLVPVVNVTGHTIYNVTQRNLERVAAGMFEVSIGDDVEGNAFASIVEANRQVALATGNQISGVDGLPGVDLGMLDAGGIAAGTAQLNAGDSEASVLASAVGANLSGFTNGSSTVAGNMLGASALGNDASLDRVAGQSAGGSAGTGSAVLAYDYDDATTSMALAAAAGVASTSLQVNADATQSAMVIDASVGTRIIAADRVDATLTTADNQLDANATGNRSLNTVLVEGADTGSFNDSAGLLTAQARLGGATQSMVMGSAGLEIQAPSYGGNAAVTSNDISASAAGNSAGNELRIADGITAMGDGSQADVATRAGATSAGADLALMGLQSNNDAPVSAMAAGTAGAIMGQLDGGSVAAGNNTISSSAIANTSGNAISAGGANLSTSAALLSDQSNTGSAVTAGTAGAVIVAVDGGMLPNTGMVSVDGNTISASAEGNAAASSIRLSGTNLAAGAGAAEASIDPNGDIGFTTQAGVVASSRQVNYSGDDNAITSSAMGVTGTLIGGDTAQAALTTSDNALAASAVANRASTLVEMEGTNGDFSAAVVNQQFNGAETDSDVVGASGNLLMGDVADTRSTVSGNSLSAQSHGNVAANGLHARVENLELANGGGAGVAIDHTSGTQSSSAGVVVANTQIQKANIDSDALGVVGSAATGNITASQIVVDGNAIAAGSFGNNADNTLTLDAVNLATGGGGGSLSNLQQGVQLTVDSRAAGLVAAGAIDNMGIHDSSVAVTSNAVQSMAMGNQAANTVAVGATNLAGDNTGATVSWWATTGVADQVLLSTQTDAGEERDARTFSAFGILAERPAGSGTNPGAVTGSDLVVSGNQASAQAGSNLADNLLVLGASVGADGQLHAETIANAAASSALGNFQSSGVDVTAETSSLIGIHMPAHTVSGSDLVVSDNLVHARADGNAGSNLLLVDAGNLTGSYTGGVSTGEHTADHVLLNEQLMDGTTTARITGIDEIGAQGSGIAIVTNLIDGGSATVAGNRMLASAQANRIDNMVAIEADGQASGVSSVLGNHQNASGAVEATVTTDADTGLGFAIDVRNAAGALESLPLTVSDNVMVASAGNNYARNTVSVAAGNGLPGAGMDASAAAGGAMADHVLVNGQQASAGASATLVPGFSGVTVQGSDLGGVGNLQGSTPVTVSGNQFVAVATINSGENSVNLQSGSTLGASAAVVNNQSTGAGTSSSALVQDAMVGLAVSSGPVLNGTVGIHDNVVAANAAGNDAANVLNALATGTYAGTGPASATSGTVSASGGMALVNNQVNHAGVSSNIINAAIGNGTPGSMQGGSSVVSGNQVMASAFGNSASNQVTMAGVAGGQASSALVSSQFNSASVTANVVGAQIGSNAGAGTIAGNRVVRGNSVGASAVGNSARNSVGFGTTGGGN